MEIINIPDSDEEEIKVEDHFDDSYILPIHKAELIKTIKQIYKNNEVALEVIKGKVPEGDTNLAYKVDGLSGATITSRGVTNMIKYWFSDSGYANLFSELDYES